MIYKLKKNLNEKIVRYKARCVVQDFRLIQDVDFDDIYVVVRRENEKSAPGP